jgi:4-amino-4-deoxy-L-arabinose transferase-like glycosyltransferase
MTRTAAAPPSIATSPSALLWLLVGLAALLALRIAALWLNATDLFFDEAQYWSWAQEPAFGYYSKPPLIAGVIGATTALCGDTTACVRLASPVLHTATALLVYLVACRLYDSRTGLWSALAFATLPGVSFSAGIISTDVPLLAAWALALLGLVGLLQERSGLGPALALGLGLGLGLNAKYAMVFFLLSLAIYLATTPSSRGLLKDRRLWLGIAIGLALIAPNLVWNATNKFATFAHTADNAKWGGSLLHIGKGFEFIGAQLGVFGPILAAGLVVVVLRAWREGLAPTDRLLLCFTLPVLVVITGQAFVSRAHANWAATAYVAGSILVPAMLLRLGRERWLRASLVVHLAIMAALIAGTSMAGRFTLPGIGDPFQRTLGWSEMSHRVVRALETARAAGKPFRAVMADDRAVTATLLYYLRDEPTAVVAWRDGPRARDHYELTRPLTSRVAGPVLLVATREDSDRILQRFERVDPIANEMVPAGGGKPRAVRLVRLEGLK